MPRPKINWTGDNNPFAPQVLPTFIEWLHHANVKGHEKRAKSIFSRLTQTNMAAKTWDMTHELSEKLNR